MRKGRTEENQDGGDGGGVREGMVIGVSLLACLLIALIGFDSCLPAAFGERNCEAIVGWKLKFPVLGHRGEFEPDHLL